MPLLGIGLLELMPFLIGLAALLVGVAGWVFAQPIAHAFEKVPIVGGSIVGVVSNAIGGAVKRVWKDLEPFGKGPATWILMLALSPWILIWYLVDTLRKTKQRANQALDQANRNYAALHAELGWDIGVVEGDIASEHAQAQAYANSLYDSAEHDITFLKGEVDQLMGAPAAASVGYVNGQIAGLQTQLNADVNTLNNTLTQDNLGLQNQLSNATSTINATITKDVTDLTNQINTNASAVPGIALGIVTGAAPGIVAQAVAQLAPTLNTVKTEVDDCLAPLCDTVTPNAKQLGDAGKLLKNLEGLFAASALMALLVAAVEDPQGGARLVEDTMGWVTPLAVDLVDVVAGAAGVVL